MGRNPQVDNGLTSPGKTAWNYHPEIVCFFLLGGRTVHFIRVNYKNLTLRRHWNGWLRGNHPRHGFIAISPETSWCISPLVALT
jgi:hypothetical protein